MQYSWTQAKLLRELRWNFFVNSGKSSWWTQVRLLRELRWEFFMNLRCYFFVVKITGKLSQLQWMSISINLVGSHPLCTFETHLQFIASVTYRYANTSYLARIVLLHNFWGWTFIWQIESYMIKWENAIYWLLSISRFTSLSLFNRINAPVIITFRFLYISNIIKSILSTVLKYFTTDDNFTWMNCGNATICRIFQNIIRATL